ncbi:glucuronate isomerase [Algoriphagus ratkowskyi]|uniref:Uronate isomerase n=1 Tax=Algoriphagus ratkowskyi TaxID=57028 RepID=A0A2W7R3T4_9BACT|nr:glucuronate isomerase [Algoriphagus ratkowskyi]PZX55483.1 glucuronate isomerase [Algoriphagus ratkowskyi]TXD79600.1 glucuronate isomerase [Algoriphagus ratkowskyi]
MPYSTTKTSYLSDDFLLRNDFAKTLYHQYAKDLPIIDYHNHLPPAEVNTNRKFENISKIWLAGDHYKWRAMRTFGINEKFITGDSSDEEKFKQWAKTLPHTLRNPLYHWSHLELKRYFGIDELLSEANATEIYSHCNNVLKQDSFSTQGLLAQMKVEVICTTDDPIDSLDQHVSFHKQGTELGMYPAFRPDKSFAVENASTYTTYIASLAASVNFEISSYEKLLEAMSKRIDYFHERGCRLSDHGLEQLYFFKENTYSIETIFSQVTSGKELSKQEVDFFKFTTLLALCKMYHAKGWVQQFHLGALRNTNSRSLRILGADTGFDSIGDFDQATSMCGFFNELNTEDQLCKTVIYNLNPRDNEVFATMIGNYNDGSVRGKIQFGSGWWYMDQKDGMEKQINTLSNMGLISCFIGMLTDSRSFLSFPRHEYFRRILCNLFAEDVANGELPWDEKWLGGIISDICYHNAKQYFDFSPKNIQV